MTPDEFRRHGRSVIDWIANYQDSLASYPVLSQSAPGDVLAALPNAAPHSGEPFDAFLRDLDAVILPGITHWQHPSFFAYFPANASGPAILGDLVSGGLGVQGMLWATSPAATELETRVLDWLADLLDLPEAFRSTGPGGGVIQHSASDAALVAVVAAIHRASGGRSEAEGVSCGRFAVYASGVAHSSIEKACRVAGLGSKALRLIDIDPTTQAARPDHLAELIARDISDGITPALVVAAVGTTGTGAVDPVRALGEIARAHGVWLHIDAAWAGVAAVVPEYRAMHDGIELADSYCTNPHKWLLTNFDCDTFWVADRTSLIGALSILPDYLRNPATESGAVIDYRDWHVPLGRRFRALKLWAVLRWYGVEGLQAHIRSGVELANRFAEKVRADDRFELVGEPSLSLVCFRLNGTNEANQAVMDGLNASGLLYLTHTTVAGRLVLRLAVGSPATTAEHIDQAWEQLTHAAGEQLSAAGGPSPPA